MLDIDAPLKNIVSLAAKTGYFKRVNKHEPKSAPDNTGLTLAVFLADIRPIPNQSGQNSTTGLVAFTGRIFGNMLKEPADFIDPNIGNAAAKLMEALSGDFELGGTCKSVDLLGQTGTPLSARAGYLEIDRKNFRIVDVYIPVIVNDIFPQSA